MKNIAKFAAALFSLTLSPYLIAQETAPKPPEHFYHLVYRIAEKDGAGKVTNTRSYSTIAATGNTRSWPIKTGNKIPLHTGEKDIQYIDLGVNIETQDVVEDGARLHMVVKMEFSSLAPEQNSIVPDPIIRQNLWGAEVVLPVGKSTVIFSSDNLEDKGQTEVALTASRIE